jgi:hypothetical protein
MGTLWYMERPTISGRIARWYYYNSSYKGPERLRPTPDLAPRLCQHASLPLKLILPSSYLARQADLPLERTSAPGREEGHG